MTKILITGGSGAVGSKAVEQLCQLEGIKINAFDVPSRAARKLYYKHPEKVRVFYGDISKKEDLMPACIDVDFVIHLAAVIPPLADDNPKLAHRVNTIGTRNLVEALEAQSPHAFLLYASSVSVYGDRLTDPLIRVGDPLLPSLGDEYAKTKIKAEAIIRASTLNHSIFRLSAIMGTDNHKVSGLMFHMPLATSMEITTPEDTARAFVNAIGREDQLNKKIFNLGGGEQCRITYEEFLSRSFAAFGLGKLDFLNHAFADGNFHCGFYADGDELESIVHFRRDTIESYFEQVADSVSLPKKWATRLLSPVIKKYLLSKSDPLNAVRNEDQEMRKRYFSRSEMR